MANIEELKKYKHIHMIGIGGVSMSGIAQILKKWGFVVTGSDWAESDVTRKLNLDGIHVVIGHDIKMVSKADVVVYTAAIPDVPLNLSVVTVVALSFIFLAYLYNFSYLFFLNFSKSPYRPFGQYIIIRAITNP